MKKILFHIVLIWAFTGIKAQTDPLQSVFTYNMAYINPASTGMSGMGSLFLWHRSQWLSFDGGPQTQMLTVEYPFKKVAFGVNMFHDNDGTLSRWNTTALFSYALELSLETTLAFGINLGADQIGYDPSRLNVKDRGEAFFDNPQRIFRLLSGVGVTVYSDRWFAGISTSNLLPARTLGTEESYGGLGAAPVYFSTGINIPATYTLTIRPSVLFRYMPGMPFNFDASVLFSFRDAFSAGITYRHKAAYILLFSAKIGKKFRVGYSFDMDATELRRYAYGSHELFLRYEFPTPSGKVRFQSPRFF